MIDVFVGKRHPEAYTLQNWNSWLGFRVPHDRAGRFSSNRFRCRKIEIAAYRQGRNLFPLALLPESSVGCDLPNIDFRIEIGREGQPVIPALASMMSTVVISSNQCFRA